MNIGAVYATLQNWIQKWRTYTHTPEWYHETVIHECSIWYSVKSGHMNVQYRVLFKNEFYLHDKVNRVTIALPLMSLYTIYI